MYLLENSGALIEALGLTPGHFLDFYRAPNGSVVRASTPHTMVPQQLPYVILLAACRLSGPARWTEHMEITFFYTAIAASWLRSLEKTIFKLISNPAFCVGTVMRSMHLRRAVATLGS